MKNNTYKNWSLNEELELSKLIESGGLSHEMIGKKLNRPTESILNKCRRLKLKSKYLFRRYEFDLNFWDNYNPKNCYYAGFITANGNVNKYCTRIEIHKQDIEFLNNLKRDIYGFDLQISPSLIQNKENLVKLEINSTKWVYDLNKNFGIFPKKAYHISLPNINLYLKFCWLIGYTDGDGSIQLRQYKNDKNPYLHISWTSCSYECIRQICELLDTHFPSLARKNRSRKIIKLSHANAYNINIYGDAAMSLYLFLNEFEVPKLNRKWNNQKINNFIEVYEDNNPERFQEIKNNYISIKKSLCIAC